MKLRVKPVCRSRKEYIEHCKLMIKDAQVRFAGKLIWQYKTNGSGLGVGVVCAFLEKDGTLFVGASKCNSKLHDKFDRDIGLWQAIEEAEVISASLPETYEEIFSSSLSRSFFKIFFPYSMHKLVCRMIFRSRRQFGLVAKSDVTTEPIQA